VKERNRKRGGERERAEKRRERKKHWRGMEAGEHLIKVGNREFYLN
jgi:hypothetical protein